MTTLNLPALRAQAIRPADRADRALAVRVPLRLRVADVLWIGLGDHWVPKVALLLAGFAVLSVAGLLTGLTIS